MPLHLFSIYIYPSLDMATVKQCQSQSIMDTCSTVKCSQEVFPQKTSITSSQHFVYFIYFVYFIMFHLFHHTNSRWPLATQIGHGLPCIACARSRGPDRKSLQPGSSLKKRPNCLRFFFTSPLVHADIPPFCSVASSSLLLVSDFLFHIHLMSDCFPLFSPADSPVRIWGLRRRAAVELILHFNLQIQRNLFEFCTKKLSKRFIRNSFTSFISFNFIKFHVPMREHMHKQIWMITTSTGNIFWASSMTERQKQMQIYRLSILGAFRWHLGHEMLYPLPTTKGLRCLCAPGATVQHLIERSRKDNTNTTYNTKQRIE